VEGLALSAAFWGGRRVLVTGHTGFMGAWLCARLKAAGARVSGYSLPAPTEPSLFGLAELQADLEASVIGDVRDAGALGFALAAARAEVVFHLAAQPLVRRSFREPIETYATNVIGTATLLNALRDDRNARVAVMVTSDKCYAESGRSTGHREEDPLGGSSPYASSKACMELLTEGFRSVLAGAGAPLRLATVRAGNVIGGGDWAEDRLVPDIVRAAERRTPAVLRHPDAVRPWQHVLDPLEGYLALAERLWEDSQFAGAWNFGPEAEQVSDVRAIARRLSAALGVALEVRPDDSVPEAATLRIDASKARQQLGWCARLSTRAAVDWTAEWYAAWLGGASARALTLGQVDRYRGLAGTA
jgi:CDP-glucose 4,6-dehydratase